VIVAGVTYRHPAVLANMAATIDHVSGGRLELGLGGAWYELEHRQYGIPFPPIGRRLAMLGEAAAILKSLWTERETTFTGRHYQLREAMCEPKPLQRPRIPLWIGGAGERVTLRHVAAQADGWNTFLTPLEEFEHKLSVLDSHCREVGRDRAEIRIQLVLQAVLGADEREAEDQLHARAESLGVELEALRAAAPAVTPERLAGHLRPYVERGVSDFLLLARPPMDRRTLELFAGAVAPELRGR
jgi:alkanesulfonate monooxygenase SsuD/methylene tetrahydromethanopterin reductase-like flavin-dependent oxidoreductase (luciferase family)